MNNTSSPIPEPPRQVAWKTCLARRWVLGLIGGMFVFFAIVILVVGLLAAGSSPIDDSLLDSGGWTASGSITAMHQVEAGWSGVIWKLEYTFDTKRGTIRGASYTADPAPTLHVDEPCEIEYLHDKPEINRIVGTQVAFFSPIASTLATVFAILGIVGLQLWLRAVLRLRIALREGRRTTAQIIEAKLLRYVNPRPVRVRYRFHDNLGMEHVASHCVGANSAIGRKLIEDTPRELPVIHDEGHPDTSRLVQAEDFLRPATVAGTRP